MLIADAVVDGSRCCVQFGATIEAMAPALTARDGETVVEAHGAQLLPGLHDHHIHLRALAASLGSVNCGPEATEDAAGLGAALAAAGGEGWLRGVGYDATVAGELDRLDLDRWVADRPVRVQHRSGKLWVLNSLALERLDVARWLEPGVERDGSGRPTGRLFRLDRALGERLKMLTADGPEADDGLAEVNRRLLAAGVTEVTDTSYTNDAAMAQSLQGHAGFVPRVHCMGDASLNEGQLKVMLDEDRLPELEPLIRDVKVAHTAGRGAAFHAVTRIELLVALQVLEAAGHHKDDRIEHGAVVDEDCIAMLRDSGCPVVTQPGFVRHRGERFRAELGEASERIYPFRSLLRAGIPVVASSDAPYGPSDPWQIMQAATDRLTEAGQVLGAGERVTFEEALAGYLSPYPGAGPARLGVGRPADLCLVHMDPSAPAESRVVGTWIAGERVFEASADASG